MIIGIGGVSRSGKSTLAENLRKTILKQKKTVEIFCQDDFVKHQSALPQIEGVPDWERPSTIKWDTLISKLEKSAADVKIVEGLFAFYPASLRNLFDEKLFLEIDRDTFNSRKSDDKRWEQEPDWYANHVWKSYNKYGKPKGDDEDYIFLDGTKPIDTKKLAKDLVD